MEVTDREHATLEWLAGFDTATVGVIANLPHRALETAPLDRPEVTR